MNDFTKTMTPEDKAAFKELKPESEKFVENLSDDDKEWL